MNDVFKFYRYSFDLVIRELDLKDFCQKLEVPSKKGLTLSNEKLYNVDTSIGERLKKS